MKSDALAVYVRTLIACPCGTSEELKENMLFFAEYVKKTWKQV